MTVTPLERLTAAGARIAAIEPGDADATVALIRRVAAFSSLDDEDAHRLCGVMTFIDVDAGVRLVEEGDPSDSVMLVLRGAVEVLRRNANAYPTRLAVVEAGEAIGEMSMFDEAPRFASCDVLEATRIALLTRADLEQLMSTAPSIASRLLLGWARLLASRLRETGGRLFARIEAARSA